MKLYWLVPKDQRNNNWVFFTESVDTGASLRDEYQSLRCHECGKIDELAAILSGISTGVKIRSKSDYLITDDGLVCTRHSLQSLLSELLPGQLQFIRLPGDENYSILLPQKMCSVDRNRAHLESHRVCSICERARETCGFPSVASLALPDNDCWIVCPEIAMENTRGRKFWFLGTQTVVEVLRREKIRGIEYLPAR